MTSARTGWIDLNTIELNGLTVSLSQPVLVARSKGYLWFPSLQRFPDGTLLAVMSSLADVHVNQTAALYAWSRDGGRSWSEPTRSTSSDVGRRPNVVGDGRDRRQRMRAGCARGAVRERPVPAAGWTPDVCF